MKITKDKLVAWGVCDLDRYAAYVGSGIELTPENIREANVRGLDFDPSWLAPKVLPSKALSAYNQTEAAALAVLNETVTPEIRAEFARIHDLMERAESDYRAATVNALAELVGRE